MATVSTFEQAARNQTRIEGDGKQIIGGALLSTFMGSRETPEMPDAFLAQFDPGKISNAHFHLVDQFQVVVDGKGRLGRHDMRPYCVHFSRAYTPYGPLVADTATGLTFLGLRTHHDAGSQRLPEKREMLLKITNRMPWQITCPITFPALQSGADHALLRAPDMADENGLAAFALIMAPNTHVEAPDASRSKGQYLIVTRGSLLHYNQDLSALSLVFVKPDEKRFRISAGAAGLQALILNFPLPQTR